MSARPFLGLNNCQPRNYINKFIQLRQFNLFLYLQSIYVAPVLTSVLFHRLICSDLDMKDTRTIRALKIIWQANRPKCTTIHFLSHWFLFQVVYVIATCDVCTLSLQKRRVCFKQLMYKHELRAPYWYI